ncbi:uncharacterized protein LOC119604327 [Lucilia sericata]|uniref:uncharacterized protein LOC119604327 n=1 Tax=Lucilia sericata TaxID=13632 RepID=UPI0018A880E0|nr:uncharacterized protein LOC119604327 [Lucilia sericata]
MFKVSFVIIGLIVNLTFAKYFEECLEVAEDTLIPVANDCRAYIYCSDEEQSFKDTCPEETYFAAETGECLMDYDNICPKATHTKEEVTTTIPIETTPATITTFPTTLTTIYEHIVDRPSRPKCARHTNSYYPHFERCEYYYKCVAGYLTILRCNFYQAWDYQKEMCVPYNIVQCYGTAKLSNFKPKLL